MKKTNSGGSGRRSSASDQISKLVAGYVGSTNPTRTNTGARSDRKLANFGDLKRSPLGGDAGVKSIDFGRPPSDKTIQSGSNGGAWTGALKSVANGGVSSLLGGGVASFGGIGCIVSGIISLFGGGKKSAPPPLVEFQMPESQQQTIYVGGSQNNGSLSGQPAAATQPAASARNQQIQYQSAQIAQAVKLALLHSSSLNDVISEL